MDAHWRRQVFRRSMILRPAVTITAESIMSVKIHIHPFESICIQLRLFSGFTVFSYINMLVMSNWVNLLIVFDDFIILKSFERIVPPPLLSPLCPHILFPQSRWQHHVVVTFYTTMWSFPFYIVALCDAL